MQFCQPEHRHDLCQKQPCQGSFRLPHFMANLSVSSQDPKNMVSSSSLELLSHIFILILRSWSPQKPWEWLSLKGSLNMAGLSSPGWRTRKLEFLQTTRTPWSQCLLTPHFTCYRTAKQPWLQPVLSFCV